MANTYFELSTMLSTVQPMQEALNFIFPVHRSKSQGAVVRNHQPVLWPSLGLTKLLIRALWSTSIPPNRTSQQGRQFSLASFHKITKRMEINMGGLWDS
jgi:hypothetical protein